MTSFPFQQREEIGDFYDTDDTYDFIGSGAFAQVYGATALESGERVKEGQRVALKVVSKKNLLTDKDRRDVINEVEILGSVNHDNCVYLIEAFQTEYHVVIVMNLVDGKELLQVLRTTQFTESMVHSVMMQLLSALSYLHNTAKIVHRDVKPENIMLTKKLDGSYHVTLVDFGLARTIGQRRRRFQGLATYQARLAAEPNLGRNASVESFDQHDSTFLATPCGTLGYLAPETLRELNQSGFHTNTTLLPRLDVYSAGIVMYLMLCGDVPFHNHGNRQALHREMENGPSFGGPRWDPISDEAKQAAAIMLQADPVQRPSVDDVVALPWFSGSTPLNERSCAEVDASLRERDYEVSVFGAIRPPESLMNEEEDEQTAGNNSTSRCVTVAFGARAGQTKYF